MSTRYIGYVFLSLTALMLSFFSVLYFSIPNVKKLDTCFTTTMHKINFCSNSIHYVRLEQVPEHFIKALLVSEDASFFHHNGFDFSEIKNSIQRNLSSGAKLRGASTISQQLVKNAFLNAEKTYWRKLIEAITTYKLEKHYTKNQILEFYLNVVEFGKDVFGIGVASNHYFNKLPSQLTLVESTYLVQLLPNPKKRSLGFFNNDIDERVLDRMKSIIKKLERYNKIQDFTYVASLKEMQSYPWLDKNTTEVYIDSISEDVNLDLEEDYLEEEMYKIY